jgi:GntR family transcriptional regulator
MSESGAVEAAVSALRAFVRDATHQGLEKLPPERELAVRFGVSRSIIRRALSVLELDRLIERRLGRSGGTYIVEVAQAAPIPPTLFDAHPRKLERDLNAIKGIPQMLREQGFTADTRVLSESIEPASLGISEALQLEEGAPVVSLLRLRLADGQPLSLERMYLDAMTFPGLLDHSPIGSLYHLIESAYGVRVAGTFEQIELVEANRQVAELLDVKPWAPLIALRRISRQEDGTPIEASVDLFRPELTRLTVHTTLG